MVGYDEWKSYNYRDNELGSIQDDDPTMREDDVTAKEIIAEVFEGVSPVPWIDEEGYLCDRDWWEPAKADMAEFRAQCISWKESLLKYQRENPEYRDTKFNQATEKYGKGW